MRVALEVQQLFLSSLAAGQTSRRKWEELLCYQAMTGLDDEQLTDLVVRLHAVCSAKFVSRGRPIALGLFRSVAMVVSLMRKNITQEALVSFLWVPPAVPRLVRWATVG